MASITSFKRPRNYSPEKCAALRAQHNALLDVREALVKSRQYVALATVDKQLDQVRKSWDKAMGIVKTRVKAEKREQVEEVVAA